MARANNKPFSVKGINVTSPKGAALWCKVQEPDYTFNAKGIYATSLVCNPDDPQVKAFIEKLEDLRDTALAETQETLGAKAKGVKARPVYKEDIDQDGNDTGNIVFSFKMSNVEDKEPGKDKIIVVDAQRTPIKDIPLVGNGSEIRCVAYANPYYMATTKEVGISLLWSKMQIIDLVEYGGGDDFDDEDGYTATPSTKNQTQTVDEDEDEDDLDF